MSQPNNMPINTATTPVIIKEVIVKNYNKMDEYNKKAAIIMLTEGTEAAVKHMFTGDNGEKLSYIAMRERYG